MHKMSIVGEFHSFSISVTYAKFGLKVTKCIPHNPSIIFFLQGLYCHSALPRLLWAHKLAFGHRAVHPPPGSFWPIGAHQLPPPVVLWMLGRFCPCCSPTPALAWADGSSHCYTIIFIVAFFKTQLRVLVKVSVCAMSDQGQSHCRSSKVFLFTAIQ